MGHSQQSRKKIRARLEQSRANQHPVSISRSVIRGVERHGVVQEIGDECVLVAVVRDGAYLNGYMALRLDLIRHVRAEHALEDFLKQGPAWPPAALARGSANSALSILECATETSKLLSVFLENKWERTFFVGVPVKHSKERYLQSPLQGPDSAQLRR